MEHYEKVLHADGFLGQGTFGIVEKYVRRADKKVFACKTIRFRNGERHRLPALQEYRILSKLSHLNIVEYVDIIWEPSAALIFMNFCEGGSLADLIETRVDGTGVRFSEEYSTAVFRQLAEALLYCHTGIIVLDDGTSTGGSWDWDPILHRDIKPGNIFLSTHEETTEVVVKLGDFGFSTFITIGRAPSTYAGTKQYLAPEICRSRQTRNHWTKMCDIFSLGCTIWELCNLKAPFTAHMDDDDSYERLPEDFSENLDIRVQACMSILPERRPDALDLVRSFRRHKQRTIQHEHNDLVPASQSTIAKVINQSSPTASTSQNSDHSEHIGFADEGQIVSPQKTSYPSEAAVDKPENHVSSRLNSIKLDEWTDNVAQTSTQTGLAPQIQEFQAKTHATVEQVSLSFEDLREPTATDVAEDEDQERADLKQDQISEQVHVTKLANPGGGRCPPNLGASKTAHSSRATEVASGTDTEPADSTTGTTLSSPLDNYFFEDTSYSTVIVTLCVDDYLSKFNQEHLFLLLSRYGTIRFFQLEFPGSSKLVVEYTEISAAEAAISQTPMVGGHHMKLEWADSRKRYWKQRIDITLEIKTKFSSAINHFTARSNILVKELKTIHRIHEPLIPMDLVWMCDDKELDDTKPISFYGFTAGVKVQVLDSYRSVLYMQIVKESQSHGQPILGASKKPTHNEELFKMWIKSNPCPADHVTVDQRQLGYNRTIKLSILVLGGTLENIEIKGYNYIGHIKFLIQGSGPPNAQRQLSYKGQALNDYNTAAYYGLTDHRVVLLLENGIVPSHSLRLHRSRPNPIRFQFPSKGHGKEIDIDPALSIVAVKRRIEKSMYIPVHKQHLFWESHELDDDAIIADYLFPDRPVIEIHSWNTPLAIHSKRKDQILSPSPQSDKYITQRLLQKPGTVFLVNNVEENHEDEAVSDSENENFAQNVKEVASENIIPRGLIQITVFTRYWRCPVLIDSDSTVSTLKRYIAGKAKVPVRKVNLYYGEDEMEDFRGLTYYSLFTGARIYLSTSPSSHTMQPPSSNSAKTSKEVRKGRSLF